MSENSVRLYFMGFTEEMVARTVLELIKDARDAKEFGVEDWALARKDAEGKVKIENDKSVDPGAARGALFGGGVGMLLAAMTGPVGMAAVVGGAAIGAAAAALKDSGLKSKDIEAASDLMVEGRTGLVIAVPLADTDAYDTFVTRNVEFEAAIKRYQTDITPEHSFAQALEEYRASQAG